MLDADGDYLRAPPFLKNLGLISRPESAALTRDSFDHDLTNCSLDTLADSGVFRIIFYKSFDVQF